jgi:putative addiction module killer protein
VIVVRQSEAFRNWLSRLKDSRAKAKIAARIGRIRAGNFGDSKGVGEGVNELRINSGPGYRVYFTRRGDEIVILLCGGDKSTQAADIVSARAMAKEL